MSQACEADTGRPIGCVVSKGSLHRATMRGYIAMLSVEKAWRKRGIGDKYPQLTPLILKYSSLARQLVNHSVDAMKDLGCEEVRLPLPWVFHSSLLTYSPIPARFHQKAL